MEWCAHHYPPGTVISVGAIFAKISVSVTTLERKINFHARTKAARNHRRATARWWALRLVATRVTGRVERALTRPSRPLNDEDCFVVNLILLSNLPQTVVVFCRVLQQRIADISR
jgi:hypothetical protein